MRARGDVSIARLDSPECPRATLPRSALGGEGARAEELHLEPEVRTKLLRISAATIDRFSPRLRDLSRYGLRNGLASGAFARIVPGRVA
jgi:hypothetical protein